MSRPGPGSGPRITVVGLGPGDADLLGDTARRALVGADAAFLRTRRHPAAAALPDLPSFDHHYEAAADFDEVYRRIVDDLVAAAGPDRRVVYAVPGSPLVAEATVELLRADPRVEVEVVPALSFLDLAWAALELDPVAAGAQLVDGTRCEVELAGRSGPFLVAQCWSRDVLSRLKLAIGAGEPEPAPAVVLHHLGLADETVTVVPWADLDRAVEPDHLTSVWITRLAAPVAAEMTRLEELVRTLRERCPWDREQTHASLTRHLVEETYEVLDAIAEVTECATTAGPRAEAAAAHLEEELGDLLFQVFFHARLAAEDGWFGVAEVARGVHDKLVGRHPHVFGDVSAPTAGAVMANWELLKAAEKGRASVTDGIPTALPALLLAAKLQRKAAALGDDGPVPSRRALVDDLDALGADPTGERLGRVLYELVRLAGEAGIDPEEALRAVALAERDRIVAVEGARRASG